jgi:hypothetical protein
MRSSSIRLLLALGLLALAFGAARVHSGTGLKTGMERKTERFQSFNRDPGWDGRNNRSGTPPAQVIRQDFGYSRTTHAGPAPGEVGGLVTPAAEPAYYGKILKRHTLNEPLAASGTLVVGEREGGNTLVGFFNAGTINEWRTPNTLALRVNGRGDGFHVHVEYATARWRAGGDFFGERDPATGKKTARLVPDGKTLHRWSLRYDPDGNSGGGTITASLDGETLVLNLDPGHKADGAAFNRFGILNVMKSADGGGSLWLDDLNLNGKPEALNRDPRWDGLRNRAAWTSTNVRPRFDFGYTPTRHAGGETEGEMGGLIFRGDERYPERMAYYADRLGELTLAHPLRASGRVCLHRGVTDSTSLLGFFHAEGSTRQSMAQQSGLPENFLGVAVEGPSREGFYFYPVYGVDREATGLDPFRAVPRGGEPPRIYPDGKPHDWTLEYAPGAGTAGRITVTLDGKGVSLDLQPEHRAIGARFSRFGIVTTHIDGNGQHLFFDDLTYSIGK